MASNTTKLISRSAAGRTLRLSAPTQTEVYRPSPTTTEADQQAEAILYQSERKRQALLDTIPELIFVVSKQGVVLEFHSPPDSDYLLSSDGLVGKSIRELLPSQISLQAMHYLEKAGRTGHTQIASYQLQMRNGVRHFEARLAVYDTDQVIALVRDVTDRTYLEKELLEISNREQMRIGQDLHDGLGQHLTGITFLAKALERKLAAQSLPEATEAGEINQLVMQALSQTRSLARGLFPVELESNGLIPAFRELADRVQQIYNITCTVEADETVDITNKNAALHLFRLAQEAISNSVRHGKAKTISVSMKRAGDWMVLTLLDDGQGFSLEQNGRKGLGLRIMTYRAQKIGGTLEIQSQPGKSTSVCCRFRESLDEFRTQSVN